MASPSLNIILEKRGSKRGSKRPIELDLNLTSSFNTQTNSEITATTDSLKRPDKRRKILRGADSLGRISNRETKVPVAVVIEATPQRDSIALDIEGPFYLEHMLASGTTRTPPNSPASKAAGRYDNETILSAREISAPSTPGTLPAPSSMGNRNVKGLVIKIPSREIPLDGLAGTALTGTTLTGDSSAHLHSGKYPKVPTIAVLDENEKKIDSVCAVSRQTTPSPRHYRTRGRKVSNYYPNTTSLAPKTPIRPPLLSHDSSTTVHRSISAGKNSHVFDGSVDLEGISNATATPSAPRRPRHKRSMGICKLDWPEGAHNEAPLSPLPALPQLEKKRRRQGQNFNFMPEELLAILEGGNDLQKTKSANKSMVTPHNSKTDREPTPLKGILKHKSRYRSPSHDTTPFKNVNPHSYEPGMSKPKQDSPNTWARKHFVTLDALKMDLVREMQEKGEEVPPDFLKPRKRRRVTDYGSPMPKRF